MTEPYSPEDMLVCANLYGAACGHGALAASLGIPVVIVCVNWPGGMRKSWINMQDMEGFLRCHKHRFVVAGRCLPVNGLALIQWEGPWTQPNVPPRVACMHRHWIAVREGQAWDANLEMWISLDQWKQFAESELLPEKATGWTVARGYEVERKDPRTND